MTFADFQKRLNASWRQQASFAKQKKMYNAIKSQKPLSKGNCGLCGSNAWRVYPVYIDLCERCTKKALKMTEAKMLKPKKPNYDRNGIECDKCHKTVKKTLKANPKVCPRCMRKLGLIKKSRRGNL